MRFCKRMLLVTVLVGVMIFLGGVIRAHAQSVPDQPVIPPRVVVDVSNQYGDPVSTTVSVRRPDDEVEYGDTTDGEITFYFNEKFIGQEIEINVYDQFPTTIVQTDVVTVSVQVTLPLPSENWVNLKPVGDAGSFGQCFEVEALEDMFSSASWNFFIYEGDEWAAACPEGGFEIALGEHDITIIALQAATEDRLEFHKKIEVTWTPKTYLPTLHQDELASAATHETTVFSFCIIDAEKDDLIPRSKVTFLASNAKFFSTFTENGCAEIELPVGTAIAYIPGHDKVWVVDIQKGAELLYLITTEGPYVWPNKLHFPKLATD